MRTFVQLRRLMDSNARLAEKIESLEAKYADHDQQFHIVFDATHHVSPHPSDLVRVDDFVSGDNSQSQAFGLANQHAIKGIAMVLWEFLQEAAVVDGR